MKKSFTVSIIILFFITSCGFKITKFNNNFKFVEINTKGNNKISYLIKNQLFTSASSEATDLLSIEISNVLDKTIKEKNIKNQITKYQIKITADINYNFINHNFVNDFKVIKKGHYDVVSKFSNTKSNEDKLVNSLVNEIVEDIYKKILFDLNDL